MLIKITETHVSVDHLVREVRDIATPHLFIVRTAQKHYETHRALRTELVKKGIEMPGTNATGPLILRKLIWIIWEGDERIGIFRTNDENRRNLNWDRQEQQQKKLHQSKAKPGLQPEEPETQSPILSNFGVVVLVVFCCLKSPTEAIGAGMYQHQSRQ